jgi:Planctomycete extracellular
MSHEFLKSLRRSFQKQGTNDCTRKSKHSGYRRRLTYESLESRQLLSAVALQSLSVSENTGEKPQSKIWEHAGQWWTVMPSSSGTWVFRLDGTSWTPTQQISTINSVHADVKSVGDLAHVLLFDGTSSQLATLQYDAGPDNRFEPWSLRPQLVNVPLSSGVETATIDIDSTGRMWVASDVTDTIEVRYSDGLYDTWSAPITVASGIKSDDISTITAMPGNKIGVLWSNQNTKRFGFRVHQDGAAADAWSADELPASQSALNKGAGFADDHLNVAVTSDGTLYAAVKTSYDSSGYPKIGLLVRRPNGVWDNFYEVDGSGTRPIVVLNEAAGRLLVAYTTSENGGDIVYKESSLGTISFGSRQTLINGTVNNVTSTKQNFTGNVVIMAAGGSSAKSVLFSFDAPPPTNLAPVVNAGADQSVAFNATAVLDGTVTDDGLPAANMLGNSWTKISGPGNVTFGNYLAVDTTATFSLSGTYVLQLAASDSLLSGWDQITINVAAGSGDPPIDPPPGSPVAIAFQDGLFPSVAYAGTQDTKLNSGSKTKNYGTAQSIDLDGSPDVADLFKWNISAIPTGSIIVSAAIELNVTATTKDTYKAYALQRAWDELSATWQRYAAGQNWATAGANGSGDHGSAVLGTFTAPAKGISRITLNSAGIAAVQGWVNNPAANYGIILQDYTVSDGADFSTSEATNAALRPKLMINYTPAAVALAFSGTANAPPVVNVGPNLSVLRGQSLALSAIVSDDGMPISPGLVTLLWSKISGPGTVMIANAAAATTTAQFDTAGSYVLRLTAADGDLSSFDELTITVTELV